MFAFLDEAWLQFRKMNCDSITKTLKIGHGYFKTKNESMRTSKNHRSSGGPLKCQELSLDPTEGRVRLSPLGLEHFVERKRIVQ